VKVAVMQPYFLPYIGYFQLMAAVDAFIVYDDIQYTKKGWINRNRILANGADTFISLPLKSDSDFLDVRDRRLAETWSRQRTKLMNQIGGAYRKAPRYAEIMPIVEGILMCGEENLFGFIFNSLKVVKEHLGIGAELIVSSTIPVDRTLRAHERIFALCKALNAETYINPIGGVALYDKNAFKAEGIDLLFAKSEPVVYGQGGGPFVPWLSIVDVMMFNPAEKVAEFLAAREIS
jgi:hypothetical protein